MQPLVTLVLSLSYFDLRKYTFFIFKAKAEVDKES